MKKLWIQLICLFIVLTLSTSFLQAQEDDKAKNTRIVNEKNYIFKADQALPMRGQSRMLTNEFDLVVTPDTVISFLPYFGRAYQAPINPLDGGIKFTSTDFSYKSSAKSKKGGWKITIEPKDASGITALNLEVFDNGQATLHVTQTHKDPISFSGYIVEGKPREKKAF
ncbi:DUF4251 domain-containing protein [Terrimonas rubra]|uniref:DUF4251 domain-containing protein n=1 Tax=Terrimonas rubra TaxID=1035890 RepID=A0ABW6AA90_9BACT